MSWKDMFPKENRYFETENGILYNSEAIETMSKFPNEIFDVIITDPPYLINYKTNHRKNKNHEFCSVIQNDNNYKLIDNFIKKSFELLKNNSPFYCFVSWKTECFFIDKIKKYNFNLKNQIIWVKNNWTAGDLQAQYGQQYEIILYSNKGRSKFKNKRYSDVWHFDRVVGKQQLHQNQKPLQLIEFILNNHSNENDIIFDGFVGSGTTLLACEKLNRRWIGIELEEKYCEITKQRILEYLEKDKK